VLRTAATHEDAVRDAVTTQMVTGRSPNFRRAVVQIDAESKAARNPPPPLGRSKRTRTSSPEFSCIVADPPWRYENTISNGAVAEHYPTLEVSQIKAMRVPAAPDAHLYLWVTNTHLPFGFEVMAEWGFVFKTVITWCKPQIGLGSWFRNATEHVLFGVRGQLRTLRNDVPTWFVADRQRHSQKPERFYELVEASSPGPRLELFARARRPGWDAWGNEVDADHYH
jgi:N6-adenosine-specific RNA methylase IME4